jgi:GT2 family glycosyltransferase
MSMTSNDSKVSVVIPLFNKEKEIARAIRSALHQSEQPAEIIVIDDGSTDSGPRIVEEMQEPLVRLESRPNAGASAARNRGTELAQSGLVAFLDADDEWKPGFLETALSLHQEFPDAGLWTTGYVRVSHEDPNGSFPKCPNLPTMPKGGLVEDLFGSCLEDDCPFCASSALSSKAVLAAVGGFPEGVSIGEDWDLWFRIALKHPIAYSPRGEVIYHLDADNRAMKRHVPNMLEKHWAGTLLNALVAGAVPARIRHSVEKFLCRHLVLLAKSLILAGSGPEARHVMAKARFVALSDNRGSLSRYPSLFEFECRRIMNRGGPSGGISRDHWTRLWIRSFLGANTNRFLAFFRGLERGARRRNDEHGKR